MDSFLSVELYLLRSIFGRALAPSYFQFHPYAKVESPAATIIWSIGFEPFWVWGRAAPYLNYFQTRSDASFLKMPKCMEETPFPRQLAYILNIPLGL